MRPDLSLLEIYDSYTLRFKIEGLFRVLKRNPLFDRYFQKSMILTVNQSSHPG